MGWIKITMKIKRLLAQLDITAKERWLQPAEASFLLTAA